MLARGGVLLLPSIFEGWLAAGEEGARGHLKPRAGGGRRPWPVKDGSAV